jgi:hypothetical protein
MRLSIQIPPIYNCLPEIGAQVAPEGAGVVAEALKEFILCVAEVEPLAWRKFMDIKRRYGLKLVASGG